MNKRKMLKFTAFVSAVVLTAGMSLTVQKGALSAVPMTAYADEAYTEGKSGQLTYRKYSDHIEIISCEMSATSVEVPETIEGLPVTVIGMYAFQIGGLKSVKIPNSVKEIGHWAFSMCSELTSVTIPDSVEKIGIRAFEMCSSLSEVNLPDHVIEFNSLVFDSTPWMTEQRKKGDMVIVSDALIDAQNCEGDVVIPSDVKYVASSAFARNTKVTSVVFPSSVNKICDNVFFYCENLTSVEAKGAESIDSMAFCNCQKLKELKISNKLKSIVDYAFADITSGATITFYGTKDEWEKVEKPSDNQFLKNSKMVFEENVTEPEPEVTVAGDSNCDGSVDMADIVLIMQALANPNKYGLNGTENSHITAQGIKNADVIGNNGMTTEDAGTIQRYLLNIISELPAKN